MLFRYLKQCSPGSADKEALLPVRRSGTEQSHDEGVALFLRLLSPKPFGTGFCIRITERHMIKSMYDYQFCLLSNTAFGLHHRHVHAGRYLT